MKTLVNETFLAELNEKLKTCHHIGRGGKYTFNELVWVLRTKFDRDFTINANGGLLCVPSVKESFIPTRFLTRIVKSVKLECWDFEDDESPSEVVVVDFEQE